MIVVPVTPRPSSRSSQRHARQRIVARIRNGLWQPGREIPPVKTLCRDLGVSHVTLRRALAGLCEEEIVERWNRLYRVKPHETPRNRASIMLVGGGYNPVDFTDVTIPGNDLLLRAFEQERRQRGVNLVLVVLELTSYTFCHGGNKITLDRAFVKRHTILGCILWVQLLTDVPRQHALATLHSLGIPMALLDNSGAFSANPAASARLPVAITSTLTVSGDEAGRYLAGLGHRRVAFVAYRHGPSIWSRNRFAGLKSALDRLAGNAEVRLFSLETDEEFNPKFERFYLDTLVPLLRRMAMESPEPMMRTFADTCERQVTLLRSAMQDTAAGHHLEPLFERILRWRGCTAWVCHNDQLAIDALGYLRNRGIRIPGDLSIMGFDNTAESLNKGCTSYSFNQPAVVRRVVATALGGPRHLLLDAERPEEIPGYVVERETTGRPV